MAINQFQKGSRQKFTKVKTAKGRKASSTRWLQRQLNDPFVKLAKERGYRSRAAFKLIEIEQKFKIIKKAKTIVDLGCAPGGWLQVIPEISKAKKIVGIDLIEIDPLSEVDFICGDFLEQETKDKLLESLENKKIDLIISDIAPPTTGHKNTDHLKLMLILDDVILFLNEHLNAGGNFVTKIFLGSEIDDILKILRKIFSTVKVFKPESSRKNSYEQYLVCLNYK